jgi:very-short-patch-repair endonuclease
MRLFNLSGRLISKNVSKYRIDWDAHSKSKLQFEVKQFLKEFWLNHIVYEEFPVYGSRMRVDFLNATRKIAVEVNGAQHASFNKFFHQNSRAKYLSSIRRDYEKYEWLMKNEYKFIEIEPQDLKELSHKFIIDKFGIDL